MDRVGVQFGVRIIPGAGRVDGGPVRARVVLAAAMAAWSAFTVATGLALNAASLALARFFFGVGEAAAFPAASRGLVRWLPASQRAFGQGFQHAGSRFGAAVTPPIVLYLIYQLSLHWVFYIFGMVGILWAVIWYAYYRNYLQEHQGVNQAELEILAESGFRSKPKDAIMVPWGRTLRNRNVWFLSSMYFCYGWVLWFICSGFPLTSYRRVDSVPYEWVWAQARRCWPPPLPMRWGLAFGQAVLPAERSAPRTTVRLNAGLLNCRHRIGT